MGLGLRNIEVAYDLDDTPYDAVLVIGGSRAIGKLNQVRKTGVPIIQRLNGMNWIHRQKKTGIKHFLKSEISNLLLRRIRHTIADALIYQSHFARSWWETKNGVPVAQASVIYNGVPLDVYHPNGPGDRPTNRVNLLMVEGSLSGGYEVGLEMGVRLAKRLNESLGNPVDLVVAGAVSQKIMQKWDIEKNLQIQWLGLVPPEQIPTLDRSAHLLFSGDPNPACPNAVIEAMACGLPVAAFDTGAIPEIVTGNAGRVAQYKSDVWRLERPDEESLVQASLDVLSNQAMFRNAARQRAEEAFGLDHMVEGYVNVIEALS
jgi:glycosyltransferase involved in cell wall biosynthesis